MQSPPPTQPTVTTRALDGALVPFSTRQYAHLLVLRSRVQAGLFAAADDLRT